jgi:hypothetical protein
MRAVAQHAGGVVDDAAGACGQPTTATMPVAAGRCAAARLRNRRGSRAQQQVLGRITAEGQFGEQHHVGAVLVARLGDPSPRSVRRSGDGTDREIELGKGNA